MLKSVSTEELKEISSVVVEESSPKEKIYELNGTFTCFCSDLETTGLKRDSEIIQIACISAEDKTDTFSMYSVPDGDVSSHAFKVNKLSTTYDKGKKVLLKVIRL